MKNEGPQLAVLLHRLAECPIEFRRIGMDDSLTDVAQGEMVRAVIADLMRMFQPDFLGREIGDHVTFASKSHSALLAVIAWLFADEWFLGRPELAKSIQKAFNNKRFAELSKRVGYEAFITDPDRREELIRVCLNLIGMRPFGESEVQANDRLNTLDTVEREKILKATAAAEQRAREVREAMARAKAMESASRYGE